MTLTTIITNIKERIQLIPVNEPVFIYIGIGTFAGLKNNNGVLEPQNYHQYPPFLQHLINSIPQLNLFIVLIDPMQEQPPYVIADKGLDWVNNNDSNQFTSLVSTANYACSQGSGQVQQMGRAPQYMRGSGGRAPTVYSLLQKIYTDPYECYGDSTNITEELRELNKYVMEENITLLYHDFTGRRNSVLADYFDIEIGTHLDHVVYGMSARQDHGCYFDLTDIGSYFPWQLRLGAQRPLIKLFNIFYYIVNDSMNRIAQDAETYVSDMAIDVNTRINIQIEQVISTIKSDLINHMLSLLRIVFRLIVGDEQREDINVEHCFNFISKIRREEFINLYNDTNYSELYNKLIDYFSKDIDVVAKLKKLDLTGKEILQFIISGDKPYEWYANIKLFF